MKEYPASQHLAMALAVMGKRYSWWKWFIILIGAGAAGAAYLTGIWWLLALTALAIGDLFVLYLGQGFAGILDLDEKGAAELREKYAA